MEIKKYIALFRHWVWLIVLGAILVGAAAYVYSKTQAPTYQATAKYLIDLAPSSGSSEYANLLTEERLASTYSDLMTTRPVLEAVARELDFGTDETMENAISILQGMVSVSSDLESEILTVIVRDTDPERAANIANTVGTEFAVQNAERENQRFAESVTGWESQRLSTEQIIEDLETQISALETTETQEQEATLSRLSRELNEAQIAYTEAFNNLQSLRVEQARNRNNILSVEPASMGVRIGPRVMTNTIIAAIIGGLSAVAIVFLIEYLDDTIKTPDDITLETGLSTLAAIAHIKGESQAERLITYRSPRAPISEAYRVLRTNLSYSAIDNELKRLLVTSSSPSEGKSTTSANLSVALAQTGKQVVLVDADLRRPSLHKAFEVSNNQGLTTALLDSDTVVTEHLQPTLVTGLRIMASGPLPPNPAELLNSQRMLQILDDLSGTADIVIVDTPPLLTVADAAILAPHVDGCLIVVEVGKTRHATLVEAQERLTNSGAHIAGVVMNRSRAGRAGYYDYYEYAYYSYEYGRTPQKPKRSRWANLIPNIWS